MKSDLKSLKFGKDTQGGGSSGLPYIKPGLPEDSPAGEYLAGIAQTSADFPLRGGTYSTIASTEDTIRISRFLTDFPKGALFTSKQVGLQKSNPKIETGEMGGRLNTQTYNLNANLLAQVFEQGTGTHINRAGFNTNELNDDKNKYAYVVKNKTKDQNRLVTLYNVNINLSNDEPLDNLISTADSLGINSDSDHILFKYLGGPDSKFGDGETLISRTTNTTLNTKGQIRPLVSQSQNMGIGLSSGSYVIGDTSYQQSSPNFIRPEQGIEQPFQGNVLNNTLSYNQLLASKVSSSADVATVMSDFRYKNLFGKVQSRDYTNDKINISTRVGIGNPGARTNAQRTGTNIVVKGGQDKVNMIPLYSDDTNPFETSAYGTKGTQDARDLIKFAFETIDNDNLSNTTKVHFRAFLTNFTDNHTADWSGQKYMGRGENLYAYQGASRQVSFNFKVAAQSKQEMLPLYQKLNYIVSSLYSDYSTQGFMRGNLHQLTIGEYFYRTPGIITSMNITVDDNYPWEIKYTEPEASGSTLNQTNNFPTKDSDGSIDFQNSNSDADMMELPQVLSVSVTFIPILNELQSLSRYTSTRKDKKGILISNDVGRQENFINRIDYPFQKPSSYQGDPEIPTRINKDNT
jgi:hypothetical protein